METGLDSESEHNALFVLLFSIAKGSPWLRAFRAYSSRRTIDGS